MGFLTLTNATLTDPADKTEVEANFTDIQTALNGGIDNDNIAASAGIDTTKLAANDYEFLVPLTCRCYVTASQPTAAGAEPIAVVALPGTTTEGVAYTVISGAWYITDDGDAAALTKFEVQLGHSAAAAWSQVGADIVSEKTITGVGSTSQDGALTINTSAITLHASTQYFLGLFLTAVGANALNIQDDLLSVTLKLRRTDGLR